MSTLYEAATAGDIEAVRRLLAAGVAHDSPGQYDQTALMEAAANGHTEIVRLLLQAGANARLQNALALDFAVRLGNAETVRLLLDAGADPERCDREKVSEEECAEREILDEGGNDDDDEDDDDGQLDDEVTPPLFDAVQRGNIEIVKMLVDAGARVDVVVHGYGLFAAAITIKNAEIFEYLWERKASLDGSLQAVAQSGSLQYLDRLLAAGADIDDPGVDGPPLVVAATAGRTEIVERLVAAGANLEQRGQLGNTALGDAVFYDNLDCARVLLKAGASLDACEDSTLIVSAISSGKSPLIRLLLEHGADPNETQKGERAPLFYAIEMNKSKMVKLLLEHGANPNTQCEKKPRRGDVERLVVGATPLMFAAQKRQRKSVELLLAAGADAALVDSKGRSAADYAAKAGKPELTQLLSEAGAPLNVGPREQHNAALLAAVRAGDGPAALAALAAGADANAADKDGCAALMEAAKRGMLPVVEALLAAGADPNRVSMYGESPLRVSVLRQYVDVVRALVTGGANVNAKQVPGSIPTDKHNTVYFSGESALHDAAMWGTAEILQLLIDAGADLNFAGDSNQTALVAAVNYRRMDTAEVLLAAGAVVRPEDELWIAPYRFARRAENPAFQALAAEVAANCGEPGEPVPHLPGAVGFKLSLGERAEAQRPTDRVEAARAWAENFNREYAALDEKANAVLDQLESHVRAAGYLLLDAGKPIGCGPMIQYVVLLPTNDKYEAMSAFGVRGNDDELSTADIIAWFRNLEAEHPFDLRGLKFDTVIIEFHALVERPDEMAQHMADICTDLFAGADGDRVQATADWLRKNRRIHFWWD